MNGINRELLAGEHFAKCSFCSALMRTYANQEYLITARPDMNCKTAQQVRAVLAKKQNGKFELKPGLCQYCSKFHK